MLVFNCNIGSVIGISVEGCSTAKIITFGVDTNHGMFQNALDAPNSIWDEYVVDTARDAEDAARRLYNTGLSMGTNAWNYVFGGDPPSSDTAAQRDRVNNRTNGILPNEEINRPRYGPYGKGSQWTNRTQLGIDAMLEPLGLVLGISLDFQDPANCIGVKVEAGTMTQLYQATISGVIFHKACGKENAPGAGGNKRHGLEGLLEYFYHHRVTNTDKDLDMPTIKIGYTVLRGWVVGMTAEPMNLDYKIWK